MRPAVAILASGGRRADLARRSVRAVRVGVLCICVAAGATHFRRRRIMRKALHVLVAVHATEHAAVDRVLQLVLIRVDAHLLAVHVFRQRGIGMAGKAIGVLELLRRA